MDAEEQLRKYIAPRKGTKIVGLIALALGLICAVMLPGGYEWFFVRIFP